jgi:serine/threonine protein kinase
MGEVYRARDKRLNRDVAIKVLGEGLAKDQDRRAQFEREARAVCRPMKRQLSCWVENASSAKRRPSGRPRGCNGCFGTNGSLPAWSQRPTKSLM